MSEGESLCVCVCVWEFRIERERERERILLILIPLQEKINLSLLLAYQNHCPSHCENHHLANNYPISMEREGMIRMGWAEREIGPRGSVGE